MELAFKQYRFSIQNSSINCIMGNGINLEEFKDSCKYIDNVEAIIQPMSNQIIQEKVIDYLKYCFEQSNHEDKRKIIDSLTIVGLTKIYLNRKIETLSNSELFLITLAGGLLKNPSIIIIENPQAYLDTANLSKVMQIFRMIKRRYKKTIIVFSNDSDFVHLIADYIFIINNDTVIISGDKYDIFSNEKLLKMCLIKIPKIIAIEKLIQKKKHIKIGLRDNVNDLIKDICFYR